MHATARRTARRAGRQRRAAGARRAARRGRSPRASRSAASELLGAPCTGRDPRACSPRWRCRQADGGRRHGRSGCTRSGTCSSTCPATAASRARWRRCAPASRRRWRSMVRSISARPVRRRGMRPLVEARVADASGIAACALLQPALAGRALPAGHEAAAARQGRRPRRLRRLPPRARRARATSPRRPATGPGRAATPSPTIRPARVSARRRSSRSCAAPGRRCADFPELLPAGVRVAAGCRDKPAALAAMHFAEHRSEREGARRRLAFEELLLAQLLFLRRRSQRRRPHRRRGPVRAARAHRALAGRGAAVRADRRPAPRDRGDPGGPRAAARRCSGC